MKAGRRRAIFERLRAANPRPATELEHRTPFELLVAVILSAQATDRSVNQATMRLFPVARTPTAIAALGAEGLAPYIRSIGLWSAKARNIAAMARILVEVEFAGELDARLQSALAGLDDQLWTGEYYRLCVDPVDGAANDGVMADQINGDWFMRQVRGTDLLLRGMRSFDCL